MSTPTKADAQTAYAELSAALSGVGIDLRSLHIDEEGSRPTINLGRVNITTARKLTKILKAARC
ncbi:hypothetical protein ABCR94_23915 [Streptomyces sp. 21So2-11]|uniref:hypothetical protein n=1 Tax=Streptomyces sp. 21So2-11 TaxID=3144408 RepID=UPI00321B1DB9